MNFGFTQVMGLFVLGNQVNDGSRLVATRRLQDQRRVATVCVLSRPVVTVAANFCVRSRLVIALFSNQKIP